MRYYCEVKYFVTTNNIIVAYALQVAVFAILATATFAAPVGESQSYSTYLSGPLESHGSLSLAHAPIAIAHAPVAISHAPVQLHSVPEVEHYVSV